LAKLKPRVGKEYPVKDQNDNESKRKENENSVP
jgi:hypothetical protein